MTEKLKTEVEFEVRKGRTFARIKDFYENGNLAREGVYTNGHGEWNWEIAIGTVKRYFANGNLKSVERYDEAGSLDGESLFYNDKGMITSKLVYSKDKKILEEFYDKDKSRLK